MDLRLFPNLDRSLTMGNELVLTDNFNDTGDSEIGREFTSDDHLFKIKFCLFMFCTQGHMRVQLNLESHLLEAGRLLVILPGTIGKRIDFTADCRLFLIAFQREGSIAEPYPAFAGRFQINLTHSPLLTLTPDDMQAARAIYNDMRRVLQQPDYHFQRETINGYMQVLFCKGANWMLRRQDEAPGGGKIGRNRQIFDRFLNLVQQDYRRQRSINFYADRLCLTPKYLSAVIHQVSGRHAGEWIKDYVILEAKALLKSRKYTVMQVADMLNFANASFFGKYFKAAVGCPPRKYMFS